MLKVLLFVLPLPLVLSFCACFVWGTNTEVAIRYAGLGFEVAGVFIVAYGLTERQRQFGLKSFKDRFNEGVIRWWARFRAMLPGHEEKPVRLEINTGDHVMVGLTGKLSIWKGVPTDASLEKRVEALEANLATLKTDQADSIKYLQQEMNMRVEEITKERQAREAEHTALKNQLKEFGTGGLQVEWVGILCLLLGVVLATASSEISLLFPQLCS